jgi:hypothetical protein
MVPTNIMTLPPFGRAFLISPPARLPSGRDVVGADVNDAVRLRRVAVGGEQDRLRGNLVELLG